PFTTSWTPSMRRRAFTETVPSGIRSKRTRPLRSVFRDVHPHGFLHEPQLVMSRRRRTSWFASGRLFGPRTLNTAVPRPDSWIVTLFASWLIAAMGTRVPPVRERSSVVAWTVVSAPARTFGRTKLPASSLYVKFD